MKELLRAASAGILSLTLSGCADGEHQFDKDQSLDYRDRVVQQYPELGPLNKRRQEIIADLLRVSQCDDSSEKCIEEIPVSPSQTLSLDPEKMGKAVVSECVDAVVPSLNQVKNPADSAFQTRERLLACMHLLLPSGHPREIDVKLSEFVEASTAVAKERISHLVFTESGDIVDPNSQHPFYNFSYKIHQ